MQSYKDFELKSYNSFRLSSIARTIWFPESIEELSLILKTLKGNSVFILGGGTNVLLKPIIERVIMLNKLPRYLNTISTNRVIVSANYPTSAFVCQLVKGFEGLYGIPGEIGGAIVMNAGSGSYTISDHLLSVTTLDMYGIKHIYNKEDIQFGRRYSTFQDKKEVLIEAVFDTSIENVNTIEFEKAKEHRKTLPKYPSAGGVFINWHTLKPHADSLIGLNVGEAVVSEKVNIIVNKGNATYDNVINLIALIQSQIEEDLQLEIKIIG
jgi:UDP-N-acetylmuramate dehydrogenase